MTIKADLDKELAEWKAKAVAKEAELQSKASAIGNIVDKDCAISTTKVSIFSVRLNKAQAKNCSRS